MKLLASTLVICMAATVAQAFTVNFEVTNSFSGAQNNASGNAVGNAGILPVLVIDLDNDGLNGTEGDYVSDDTNSKDGTIQWDDDDFYQIMSVADGNTDSFFFQIATTVDETSAPSGYTVGTDDWYVLLIESEDNVPDAGESYVAYKSNLKVPADGGTATYDFSPSNMNLEVAPEPASLALFGLGSLMMLRRRRA